MSYSVQGHIYENIDITTAGIASLLQNSDVHSPDELSARFLQRSQSPCNI